MMLGWWRKSSTPSMLTKAMKVDIETLVHNHLVCPLSKGPLEINWEKECLVSTAGGVTFPIDKQGRIQLAPRYAVLAQKDIEL